MSSVKVPVQSKPLPKTYLSTCILDNRQLPDPKWWCVCQGIFTLQTVRTFANSTPQWLFCLQKLFNINCTVKKNSSPFRIQMPIFHKLIHDEIYEAKVTTKYMWNDWLKYCCQLSNLAPLSFSSHPRGVIDKIKMKSYFAFFFKIMSFIIRYSYTL